MREIKLKIFNPEVVDCSSTWGYLAPPIESLELLVDILLKLLQSNLIINIGEIELKISPRENSPNTTYYSPKVIDKYFLDVLDYDLDSYDLYQGSKGEDNKLNELYVEKKEGFEIRIRKLQERLEKKYPQEFKYLILSPGIDGVKHAIKIIQDLDLGAGDSSVNYLTMHVDIIWKTWINYYNSTTKERIIFDLIRDDEEELNSVDEVKELDLNIRKNALNAFSHIGFEFQGELGYSSELSLGKKFTYITNRHYDEILSFIKMKFNKQFTMGFVYG